MEKENPHDKTSDYYQRGIKEMRKHLGPTADAYIAAIEDISPEFAWVNVTFPFGELYPREILDIKTREMCTVAALTVQGFSLPQLELHIQAALRAGASREEITEIITQMLAYAGFPAATNALKVAAGVFSSHDAESKK